MGGLAKRAEWGWRTTAMVNKGVTDYRLRDLTVSRLPRSVSAVRHIWRALARGDADWNPPLRRPLSGLPGERVHQSASARRRIPRLTGRPTDSLAPPPSPDI